MRTCCDTFALRGKWNSSDSRSAGITIDGTICWSIKVWPYSLLGLLLKFLRCFWYRIKTKYIKSPKETYIFKVYHYKMCLLTVTTSHLKIQNMQIIPLSHYRLPRFRENRSSDNYNNSLVHFSFHIHSERDKCSVLLISIKGICGLFNKMISRIRSIM